MVTGIGFHGGLVVKSCLTLTTSWTVADKAPLPMGFPGKNTGAGCHFLLQGIFPAQELNPCLLHCRQILYQLRLSWCSDGVESTCNMGYLGWEDTLKKATNSSFWPGEFHGHRSLADYNPYGCKETR